MQNWSRNISFNAAKVHEPTTIDELQRIVSGSSKVRAIGATHSFNAIADTSGDLISMTKLDGVIAIDRDRGTVTVEAGITYGALGERLHAEGLALTNMGSLPHFSVVGACATGTHGSGDGNGGLATQLVALDFVTGNGELMTVSKSDPDFGAIAIGLGAFGIVARATLAVEETYQMAQELHLELPLATAIDHLDAIFASAYSVSYFTDYQTSNVNQLWRKYRLDPADELLPQTPETYFGAKRSRAKLGPKGPDGTDNITEQFLEPGPWFERLPHVKRQHPMQPGSQLQTEYFVAREHGPSAFAALADLGPLMAPVMVMGEVRTVAGDDLWLSPYPFDSLALHLSWTTDWPAVRTILPEIEAALAPFEPRPHWGKLYEIEPAEVRGLYPRFDEWAQAVNRYDPTGIFRNDYVEQLLA